MPNSEEWHRIMIALLSPCQLSWAGVPTISNVCTYSSHSLDVWTAMSIRTTISPSTMRSQGFGPIACTVTHAQILDPMRCNQKPYKTIKTAIRWVPFLRGSASSGSVGWWSPGLNSRAGCSTPQCNFHPKSVAYLLERHVSVGCNIFRMVLSPRWCIEPRFSYRETDSNHYLNPVDDGLILVGDPWHVPSTALRDVVFDSRKSDLVPRGTHILSQLSNSCAMKIWLDIE